MRRTIFNISYLLALSINSINLALTQDIHTARRLSANELLDYYRSLKGMKINTLQYENITLKNKCRFWIQAQIIKNWNEFTIAQKKELSMLMQFATMQKSKVIGHFKIHYDTSGYRAPSLLDKYGNPVPNTWQEYVDSVGRIFNEVWNYQINILGFAKPPLNSEQLYDLYIDELSDNEYGATMYDPSQPIDPNEQPPRFSSYILIDNNFSKRYSTGMNALKVTAVHELSHAIQIGAYGLRYEDFHAHEITSTWLEDVIYTEVNDYYQYLVNYFGDSKRQLGFWQGLPFNSSFFFLGYERAIWGHFLSKRFEPVLMRKVWEQMRNYPFLESTEIVLRSYGSNLESAFAEFTKWNYFTADRANTELYYPEGDKYPLFQPLQKTIFNGTTFTMNASVYALSSSLYEFSVNGNAVIAVVANINVNMAKQYDLSRYPLDITLKNGFLLSPYWDVLNGLKLKVNYSDLPTNWTVNVMQRVSRPNAAPNPFRLSQEHKLFLPINEDKASVADVFIYNSSYDLAYSGKFKTSFNETGETRVIEVPASLIRVKLSSGVYFIFAKTINGDYKWKVAMIR